MWFMDAPSLLYPPPGPRGVLPGDVRGGGGRGVVGGRRRARYKHREDPDPDPVQQTSQRDKKIKSRVHSPVEGSPSADSRG